MDRPAHRLWLGLRFSLRHLRLINSRVIEEGSIERFRRVAIEAENKQRECNDHCRDYTHRTPP
jgi:hypothetical protein